MTEFLLLHHVVSIPTLQYRYRNTEFQVEFF